MFSSDNYVLLLSHDIVIYIISYILSSLFGSKAYAARHSYEKNPAYWLSWSWGQGGIRGPMRGGISAGQTWGARLRLSGSSLCWREKSTGEVRWHIFNWGDPYWRRWISAKETRGRILIRFRGGFVRRRGVPVWKTRRFAWDSSSLKKKTKRQC